MKNSTDNQREAGPANENYTAKGLNDKTRQEDRQVVDDGRVRLLMRTTHVQHSAAGVSFFFVRSFFFSFFSSSEIGRNLPPPLLPLLLRECLDETKTNTELANQFSCLKD